MPSLLKQMETVPVTSLEFYPGNPRVGNVPVIADSLRENQQYAPIVVQRSTRYVLAGNHTLKAAISLGWDEIDVVFVDVNDDRARRIVLSSNRTAELGGYDDDALVELLSYLDDDYEGTGWSEEDVEALINPVEELPARNTDPDHIPAPPAEPISAPGDVWILGPHRVLCGDSTDVAAVEAMLAGDRCDCMWTDPPYGVDYVGKTKDALTIQNDGSASLPELLAGAFATATVALKPGAPVYIAHADMARVAFETAFHAAGWLFRQNLIWVKDVLVLGHADYHWRHEPILYGFTDGGEGRLGRGGPRWQGDDAQTTVFEVAKPPRNAEHPTMKPVELIVRHLNNSCPPKGLVYEPFGGSGSTLIAAHQTGRIARVVELDPRYVDVICRRHQEHAGTKPERLLGDGTTEPVDFT